MVGRVLVFVILVVLGYRSSWGLDEISWRIFDAVVAEEAELDSAVLDLAPDEPILNPRILQRLTAILRENGAFQEHGNIVITRGRTTQVGGLVLGSTHCSIRTTKPVPSPIDGRVTFSSAPSVQCH